MFKFHHVSLSVKNLNLSIEFYQALGFQVMLVYKSENGELSIAHLKLGEMFLELFSYKNYYALPLHATTLDNDLPTIGVKHFGLQVECIVTAREKLEQLGFLDIHITHGKTGIDYFFVQDPSGIFLEVVQDSRTFVKEGKFPVP
jgi:glyoxylase I family protein